MLHDAFTVVGIIALMFLVLAVGCLADFTVRYISKRINDRAKKREEHQSKPPLFESHLDRIRYKFIDPDTSSVEVLVWVEEPEAGAIDEKNQTFHGIPCHAVWNDFGENCVVRISREDYYGWKKADEDWMNSITIA